MKKKYLATIIAALLTACTLLGGCGDKKKNDKATESTTKQTEEGQSSSEGNGTDTRALQLIVGTQMYVPGAGCFDSPSTGLLTIGPMIYDTLFYQVDTGTELSPCIAKSYEVVDEKDGTATIDVTLFDYVHDSEGTPITASDVVFSYETYMASGNSWGLIGNLQTLEAVDDTTVRMIVEGYEDIGTLETILSSTYIVSEQNYDEETFALHPVGTGPCRLEELIPGSTLTLLADENYWQTDENYLTKVKKINFDKIIYNTIAEESQLAVALETGEIDVIDDVGTDNLQFFMDDEGNPLPGYTVASTESEVSLVLNFSMAEGSNVWDDVNLRKAILYAIDSDAITNTVMGKKGTPSSCYGSLVAMDYNSSWADDYFNFDEKIAKDYLDKSDYLKKGSPVLRICYEASDAKQKVAQMIMSYLQTIGVKSELLACETALFNSYKNDFGQWDICLDNYGTISGSLAATWGTVLDYNMYMNADSPRNVMGMHNEELQKLVDTAKDVETAGQEATDAVHAYMVDQAIGYGIYVPKVISAAQDGITEMSYCKAILLAGACEFSDIYASGR